MPKFVYSFYSTDRGRETALHAERGQIRDFRAVKSGVQQVLGLIDHGRAVGKPIFHADEVKNHHKEDADGYAGGKQARFSFKDVMFIQK